MNQNERDQLIRGMRDALLEELYTQPKYGAWPARLAVLIHAGDVALGEDYYGDIRLRYPGPRPRVQSRAA